MRPIADPAVRAVIGQRIQNDGQRRWITKGYDNPDVRIPGRKSIATHPRLMYYASIHGKLFHRSLIRGLEFQGASRRPAVDDPFAAAGRRGDRVIGETVYSGHRIDHWVETIVDKGVDRRAPTWHGWRRWFPPKPTGGRRHRRRGDPPGVKRAYFGAWCIRPGSAVSRDSTGGPTLRACSRLAGRSCPGPSRDRLVSEPLVSSSSTRPSAGYHSSHRPDQAIGRWWDGSRANRDGCRLAWRRAVRPAFTLERRVRHHWGRRPHPVICSWSLPWPPWAAACGPLTTADVPYRTRMPDARRVAARNGQGELASCTDFALHPARRRGWPASGAVCVASRSARPRPRVLSRLRRSRIESASSVVRPSSRHPDPGTG